MIVLALAGLGAEAPPAPAGRVALGQYGGWGAFRDRTPARCYAIAEPLGGGDAFATISSWPGSGVRSQVQFRLRRPAVSATVTLAGVTMPLIARERDAWPLDLHGERRLAALLRRGGTLEVASRDARGRRSRDRYALEGAPSAIDAMRLGCLILTNQRG